MASPLTPHEPKDIVEHPQDLLPPNPEVAAAPPEPGSDELRRAYKILSYAHESAASILDGFTALRASQGGGTTTDEQQDLLRAMLVFAAAGLDSCVKQIVKDALPALVDLDEHARRRLRDFAARRLRRDSDSEGPGVNTQFLADVLIGNPEENLVLAWLNDLTGSSLQSRDELYKVAAALCVADVPETREAIDALGDTFRIRNQISHEMDINFDSVNRNRNSRRRNDMVNRTNGLLSAADTLLRGVDQRLVASRRSPGSEPAPPTR